MLLKGPNVIKIIMSTSYWKYTTFTAAPITRLHLDRVSVVCMFGDVWLQTAGIFGVRGRSSVRAVRWRDCRTYARSWRESNSQHWLCRPITQTSVFVILNSTCCYNVFSTNWRQNVSIKTDLYSYRGHDKCAMLWTLQLTRKPLLCLINLYRQLVGGAALRCRTSNTAVAGSIP